VVPPVSTYSHMFATVNLLNLMKFLTLRCHGHSQYEIRVYANAMHVLARTVAPVAMKAWETDGQSVKSEPQPAILPAEWRSES
jgi:thymidylate synthase (FAD)